MPAFPAQVSLVLDQDVTLAENSDLTITVLGPVEDDAVKHVTDIYVSSAICLQSPYLGPIITTAEDPSDITLGGELKRQGANKYGGEEGENKEGVLVWLAHLHKVSEERMKEIGLFDISVTGIWQAVRMWKTNEPKQKLEVLQPWFNKWYDTAISGGAHQLDIETARLLALPCQLFDHAVGFARVTKYLAYHNIGHIKERQPKGFNARYLHLEPAMFVGPANHARGGLKTCLHKSLWKKAGSVLRFDTTKCSCWDKTIGQYLAALVVVDAFPIEDVISRASIADIIARLKEFKLDYIPPCNRCRSIDWVYVVRKAIADTEKYFDGLCLDCMDRSKPRGKGLDDEYWKHNESVAGRWDTKCRIKHNQSTWYVSWLGRDDTRQKLLKKSDYRTFDDE